MKRPLVALTLFFSLGILFGTKIALSFIPIYFLAGIILLISILAQKQRTIFNICILFLAFFLGIILLKNSEHLPSCHISKYAYQLTGEPCLLKGFIDDEPKQESDFSSFRFRIEEIQVGNLNRSACGQALVRIKGGRDFHYGQQLLLLGDLRRPFSFNQSYRDYLKRQGIHLVMQVKSAAEVTRLNRDKGSKIKKISLWIKRKIENVIFKYVSHGATGILDAMILGERSHIPGFIIDSMVKSGTIHILVVSGFNVGIVAFAVILTLKVLRIPKRARIILAIPLLILYCLATGVSSPVVRATIMALVFISSYLFKRQADIYNSLALSALFILALNPQQLFDVGFQLSFASVGSIIWLYPKIRKISGVGDLKMKFLRFMLEGCLVSFSAWLGTMGFITYYFRIFSPVTVLANLVIVPLASLITLCGFSLVTAGLVLPALAPWLGHSSESLVLILISLNSLFIKLPGAYFYL
jgi:competence protein ComEC